MESPLVRPMHSPLARLAGRSPTTQDELDAMRAAAWHQQGFVCLRPEEIADKWTQRVILNEAERRFGKRNAQPEGKSDGKEG